MSTACDVGTGASDTATPAGSVSSAAPVDPAIAASGADPSSGINTDWLAFLGDPAQGLRDLTADVLKWIGRAILNTTTPHLGGDGFIDVYQMVAYIGLAMALLMVILNFGIAKTSEKALTLPMFTAWTLITLYSPWAFFKYNELINSATTPFALLAVKNLGGISVSLHDNLSGLAYLLDLVIGLAAVIVALLLWIEVFVLNAAVVVLALFAPWAAVALIRKNDRGHASRYMSAALWLGLAKVALIAIIALGTNTLDNTDTVSQALAGIVILLIAFLAPTIIGGFIGGGAAGTIAFATQFGSRAAAAGSGAARRGWQNMRRRHNPPRTPGGGGNNGGGNNGPSNSTGNGAPNNGPGRDNHPGSNTGNGPGNGPGPNTGNGPGPNTGNGPGNPPGPNTGNGPGPAPAAAPVPNKGNAPAKGNAPGPNPAPGPGKPPPPPAPAPNRQKSPPPYGGTQGPLYYGPGPGGNGPTTGPGAGGNGAHNSPPTKRPGPGKPAPPSPPATGPASGGGTP